MNSDGTNRVDLYHTSLTNYSSPKFSPDGTKLVFVLNDSIYTIGIDGSGKTFLAIGDYPQFTPNGSYIIYFNNDLYRMSIDGNNITNITNGMFPRLYINQWQSFIISPDGLKTAFCIPDSTSTVWDYNLYIIDTDGNNRILLTKIVPIMVFGYIIKFSPNGSRISSDSRGEIYTISLDGSNLTRITQSNDYISSVCPIFAENGEKIVFQQSSSP